MIEHVGLSATLTSYRNRWKRLSSAPSVRSLTGAHVKSGSISCACRMPSRPPAASTIYPVLDRHGLVQPMARRRNRAEGMPLSEDLHPDDLWCTDHKDEFQLNDKRYCYPLTATDYSSRYLLCVKPWNPTAKSSLFPP